MLTVRSHDRTRVYTTPLLRVSTLLLVLPDLAYAGDFPAARVLDLVRPARRPGEVFDAVVRDKDIILDAHAAKAAVGGDFFGVEEVRACGVRERLVEEHIDEVAAGLDREVHARGELARRAQGTVARVRGPRRAVIVPAHVVRVDT
ncbi:hypothetical protein C9890_0595 [Perkinsus sp. BL_2016]|nr:hypothetical protein C9890_0595 [Perkinsus sp. BL_2016]